MENIEKSNREILSIKTLTNKILVITEDSIIFDGNSFDYNDVTHWYFGQVNDKTYGGAKATLDLKVKNIEKTLSISKETILKYKAEKLDDLSRASEYIRNKSFSARIAPYINSLKINKYFTYQEKEYGCIFKFHMDGKIEVQGSGFMGKLERRLFGNKAEIKFHISELDGIYLDFGIDINRTDVSARLEFRKENKKITNIDIYFNQDILFNLIHELYGIKWKETEYWLIDFQ
jgi:hypothetical protein